MKNICFAMIGGAGKMGTALIDGMLASKQVVPEHITATARHRKSLDAISNRGIQVTQSNVEAVGGKDVIVLSVGTGEVVDVLENLSEYLTPNQLIISIVTGVSTTTIESHIPASIPVIRANPNIAALVGESATVLCSGTSAASDHVAIARSLFSTVGIVEQLDEGHMNASTGLGGCGPAFIFKIIEAMSEGGVKMGMPRDISRKLAAQVLKGSAELVLSTGRHPASLKDEVTTPGGCTIAGIAKLQERGIAIALIDAVETSSIKAGELFDD